MKRLKKKLACVLVTSIVASTLVVPVHANDYMSHWAGETIAKWEQKGLLKGYEDGSFKPDNKLTRAEFASLLVRIFGYNNVENAKQYTDVEEGAWYADAVAYISHIGLMYEDGEDTFRPNQPITREEASYALAKAFSVTGKDEEVEFKDEDEVASWAQNAVEALHTNTYLTGTPEGYLYPKAGLTRAEFLTMIERLSTQIINVAGTYTESVQGNVVVNTRDVVLKDMVIEGDLYLGVGIGDGDVYLEDIEVKGQVFVEGGGENSIKSKNSKYYDKFNVSAENPVRIVIEGDAVKLEAYPGTKLILTGNFDEVIASAGIEMQVKDAIVATIVVAPVLDTTVEAKPPVITVDESAIVENIKADAAVELKGEGKVESLVVNAEGVTIEKEPEHVTTTDKDLTVDIGGEAIKPGTGNSNGSASDSGGTTQPQEKYYLSGQVVFDGEPVEYAEISVYDLILDKYVVNSTTDKVGKFQFSLKAGNRYGVEAWVETEEGLGYFGETNVTLDGNKSPIIELQQVPTVNITVTDRDGNPVPDVKVVELVDGNVNSSSRTDNLGQQTSFVWDIDKAYGYAFYIGETLMHEIPGQVIANDELNIKYDVVLDEIGLENTIKGQVVDQMTGEPAAGVEVELYAHHVTSSSGGSNKYVDSTITDEKGNYTFNLETKQLKHYQVEAKAKDAEGTHYGTYAIDVRFLPYETLALKPLYGVTVNVVDADNKPLDDVNVQLNYGGVQGGYTTNGVAELYSVYVRPSDAILTAELDGVVMAHPINIVEGTYSYDHTFKFDVVTDELVLDVVLEETMVTIGDGQIEAEHIGIRFDGYGFATEIKDNKGIIKVPSEYVTPKGVLYVEDADHNTIYEEEIVVEDRYIQTIINLNEQVRYSLTGDVAVTTGSALNIVTDAALTLSLGDKVATNGSIGTLVSALELNNEGEFDQAGLIEGIYTLRTTHEMDGIEYMSTDTIRLKDDCNRPITLLPVHTTHIRVVDQFGNALPDIRVQMQYQKKYASTILEYTTSPFGEIEFVDGIEEGTLVRVYLYSSDTIELDESTKEQELIIPSDGGVVTLRVTVL